MNFREHEQSKAQFGKVSQAYVTSDIHAKGWDLGLMLERAGPVEGRRLLDIATGGGHTALAFAEAGAAVTATDLTPRMLEAAETHIRASSDKKVDFLPAAAEALPFEPSSFELVTCRIAAHHFADPRAFLREVARVLVPGGRFLLIDNIAPIDERLAEVMNAVEKKRDPSHVEAYTLATWLGWLTEVGLDPVFLERWKREKDFTWWLGAAQVPEEVGVALEQELLALDEPSRAYLEVRVEAGRVRSISHESALLIARSSMRQLPV